MGKTWPSRPAVCSPPSGHVWVQILSEVQGETVRERIGCPKLGANIFKHCLWAIRCEKKRRTRRILMHHRESDCKVTCDHFCMPQWDVSCFLNKTLAMVHKRTKSTVGLRHHTVSSSNSELRARLRSAVLWLLARTKIISLPNPKGAAE